jgi:hypothetical protein
MRALWITLALTLGPGLIRAEVVYQQLTEPNFAWNAQGASWSSGQSFQNIAQDSTVSSIVFKLRKTGSTAFTGSLSVNIYAATGSATNYLPNTAGTLFATSSVAGSSILGDAANISFSGFSTSSNLVAGSFYVAVLDLTSLGGISSSEALEIGGSSPIPSGTYSNFNRVQNTGSGFTVNSNQQMYGTINVTAVPEPGTLLLGGIAAACGGGGAWWRRKRHQASKATAKESVA